MVRDFNLLFRSVLLSSLALAILSAVPDSADAAPSSQQQQYQTDMMDIYDWLTDHELERRTLPSMRLRFGKRDSGRGMWTVAQRSMPSLRLRFGKRDGEGEETFWEEPEVERRGGSRSPALRMRFGKRAASTQKEEQGTDSDLH